MAILTPLIVFITLITVDFGRLIKYKIGVESAARSGALYGSVWDKKNPVSNRTDTAGISSAVNADLANNLENLQLGDVTVTSSATTDEEAYDAVNVVVTVRFRPLYQFNVFMFQYDGKPIDQTETCTMRVRPRQ